MPGRRVCKDCNIKFGWTLTWDEDRSIACAECGELCRTRATEKARNQKAIEDIKKQRIVDEDAIAKKKAIDDAEHARQLDIRQIEKEREKRQEELDMRRKDIEAQTKRYEADQKTTQVKISSESANTKAEYDFKQAQERTKQVKAQAEEKIKVTEATEYTKQLQKQKEILDQYASMIDKMANIGIDKTEAASFMSRFIGTLENQNKASAPNTLPKIKEEPKRTVVFNRRTVFTAPV